MTAMATGGYNVALGHSALVANVTGVNNVAIGYQTLNNSTDKFANVAIGYRACKNNNSSYGAFIGDRAASNGIVGGEKNVAVGHYSLFSLTNGAYKVDIRDKTLDDVTNAEKITSVGNDT